MQLRHIALAAALISGLWITGTAQAQGFVFGTAEPKAPAAAPAGARNAKVESAQRLLARIGLLRETPSGTLTPATLDAMRAFAARTGTAPASEVNDALLNAIRRHIWTSQNWSSGNYKGKEKIVDAQGLREAQILLGKLGFSAGPLDGTFGPQTQVATEAFQESQGVSVDGLITSTVLMNLRRAVNGAGAGAKETLRVLNWPDYIEPSVLQDFEKEYNIRVIYDIFADNDDLQARLGAAGTPYDVVFPTANAVPGMAAKGLLGKLDKASLKNLNNIDPRVDATLRAWDKDGAYSLPYMWYTVGIAWNPKFTSKAFPGHSVDTLATVFAASGADGHNCHSLCEQLAGEDRQISPTRFHNSVHNAAAGYWGIATRSMAPCQVLGAFDASFGAGLLDALAQVALDGQPVLLVAYDSEYPEPLHAKRDTPDCGGVALLLSAQRSEASLASITVTPSRATADVLEDAALEGLRQNIPAMRALPLLQRLARGAAGPVVLDYLAPMQLRVELQSC